MWNCDSTIHISELCFRCVFLPDSGAFFVNYVITSALIGTAFELVRLPELFVYAVRMCYTHNEGERLLVKKVWCSTADSRRSLICHTVTVFLMINMVEQSPFAETKAK